MKLRACHHLEFDAINGWMVQNKLQINFNKTNEVVLRKPLPFCDIDPLPLEVIERVFVAKLPGVTASSDCRFYSHVSDVVTIYSQLMFLMKSFKGKGLDSRNLEIPVNAIILLIYLARALYAVYAWGGFMFLQCNEPNTLCA